MLLDFLMGGTVFLSVVAIITLSASLFEGWIQRHSPRDRDYRLALSILKWVCLAGLVICIILTFNYVWRFATGLPGSTIPGPESNSLVSLASFVATFSFFAMVGVATLYILWESDEPSDDELARRKRIASTRREAEQRRRQRRLSDARREENRR